MGLFSEVPVDHMPLRESLERLFKLRPTVDYINQCLDDCDPVRAAEAYNELTAKEQMAINHAPTKLIKMGLDPAFSTERRAYIQGKCLHGQPMAFIDARISAGNYSGDQIGREQ